MEHCWDRLYDDSFEKIRGQRVLSVLLLMILMIAVVAGTPTEQLENKDMNYNNMIQEPMGEEVAAVTQPIRIPDIILDDVHQIIVGKEPVVTAITDSDIVAAPIEAAPSMSLPLTETPNLEGASGVDVLPSVTVPPIDALPPVTVPPIDALPPVTVPPIDALPPVTVPPIDAPPPVTAPPTEVLPPVTVPPVEVLPPVTVPPSEEAPPETAPPIEILPPETVVPPDASPPDTTLPPETVVPPVISPTAGFLVNEYGMIYGVDEGIASSITQGLLTLPSEGCTGIASGAFAAVANDVVEISIPANIVNIENGAFNHLTNLFWVQTAEDNPAYASMHGILFDKAVTSTILVPSAKTHVIEIPGTVTRLEDYSLANTQLSMLVMRSCGLIEVGDRVFGEGTAEGLRILAPPYYMEEYKCIFEGTGAVVK